MSDPSNPDPTRARPQGRVVRVIPDVGAINREFDYLIPDSWLVDARADRVVVGSMVRVVLHGRRVAGWVTAVDVEAPHGVKLSELIKLSSLGPDSELMDLSNWAAWRWSGRRVAFLRAASPPRMIAGAPSVSGPRLTPPETTGVFDEAFRCGTAVVRVPPAHDVTPVAMAACRLGDSLIVVPDQAGARALAVALRRTGVVVALGPDDWALAAAGATVVGTRSAAWMPMANLAAAVVVDEHDEALKNERMPTWHAREVVMERARRRGAPVVLTSPIPTLEALRAGKLFRPPRSAERDGWPVVEVLDRRDEDPTRGGLFAEGLIGRIRGVERVVCVLNRKGRSRLLACATCGELVRTVDERFPMVLVDKMLESYDGSEIRPVVCSACGSTTLRNLRMGVTRAREELAAMVHDDVDEVTAGSEGRPSSRVVIGTEAALHRVDSADLVVFLDFDQELLIPRQRASEQALALVARAARLVGPRTTGGRIVIQTRMPDHAVVRAAVRADPSIVATAERDRRREIGIPPYGAEALVSGAGGAEFIQGFGHLPGVDVRGPLDGRWLLRSASHEPLLDALQAAVRPVARLRIEVDPLRV